MTESNSTASFLIDSLLDNNIKKESATNSSHNGSTHSERDSLEQRKAHHYNLRLYQSYSDRTHYKTAVRPNNNKSSYENVPIIPPHTHIYQHTQHNTAHYNNIHNNNTHYNNTPYNNTPYNDTHYNNDEYHQQYSNKAIPAQRHNVYSYYSKGRYPSNYYEYEKNSDIGTASSAVAELQSDQQYPSMAIRQDTSNFDLNENNVDIPKKVVLSEESYLRLLESYRMNEEMRRNTIFKKKRKQRTIFTKQQTELLENMFNQNEYVTLEERAGLAKQLKISEKQVKIWFQNRRNKLKKINSSLSVTDQEKPECSADDSEEDDESNIILPMSAPDD